MTVPSSSYVCSAVEHCWTGQKGKGAEVNADWLMEVDGAAYTALFKSKHTGKPNNANLIISV